MSRQPPASVALAAGRSRRPAFEPMVSSDVEQGLAQRFETQVRRHPDRPAVIDADREWTYRALDEEANRIAAGIARSVDVAHPRVGLMAHPGGRLVAAVIGALKSGGAYVQLDPSFPANRLGAIARHAELDLVIEDSGLESVASAAFEQRRRVARLEDLARTERRWIRPSAARAGPEDLAYLLYTSGSTGAPKGVIQRQRNVLHNIRVFTNLLRIAPTDRILAVARPSFVAWGVDVFAALLNGAAVCLVDLAESGFVGLARVVEERGVTIYHSTPTVYRELLAELKGERLPNVRAVALGGEPVRVSDLEGFRGRFADDAAFVNVMGSTESSICLAYVADASTRLPGALVPAGFPTEETEVLLLGDSGREAGEGQEGEITVRSRFVALGYWKEEALTASAFHPDPDRPGLVTYRTGDIGRRLPDGAIESVGRRDRQVKVHGVRVEIAEIEGVLAAMPEVGQVAVEQRPVRGRPELVAYLQPAAAARPSHHDLRMALRDQLPATMVPVAFVWMDRLPRTTSNKIDRAALPDPDASEADHGRPAASMAGRPHDQLERRLVAIWERLLGRRGVGIDDDFFERAGSSLLAVRMFDEIWRATGSRLPVSLLLERPTIRGLAGSIRERQAGIVRDGSLVQIRAGGSQRPLFVIPGAGSRILYLRNLARHLRPDQPLFALHQAPQGTAAHADRRVEALAAQYVAELRRAQPEGPYDLVGFSFGGPLAFEMAQQLGRAGQRVELLALIDSRYPGQSIPGGIDLRRVPRRLWNQLQIVRGLGLRDGIAYLRQRAWIARVNSTDGLSDFLADRLPAPLARRFRSEGRASERAWLAADRRAYEGYVPSPYPGHLVFLWARHNQHRPRDFDTRRGWAEVARGGFEVHAIPGSHLTVLVEPLARITASVLDDALQRARRAS